MTDLDTKIVATATNSSIALRDGSGNLVGTNLTAAGLVATATNIAGGLTNKIPYQTGAGITAFTAASGTDGQTLMIDPVSHLPLFETP